jgi:hypothetical protein
LEDQIGWYDRKSGDNQRLYKWLKLLEIAVAAAQRDVAAKEAEAEKARTEARAAEAEQQSHQ